MNISLLLSSRNPDKLQEYKEILSPFNIVLHSLLDFPDAPETTEDKDTIHGNAIKKAMEGSRFTGMLCIADDSGLFIDALNGDPGVYSARWAGEGCSYQDNRRKILLQMEGLDNRAARFETALALADSTGLISVVCGVVKGQITLYERGDMGFGYDSIFEVEGRNRTYAELSDKEKNSISHRGLAIREMLPTLKRMLDIQE
ncbi:MAG: RdgB/HAM1 family non-canonical purine NTP pyrophosphatase [Candidatus Cloacimonetes bacterium]|jgi:XTP/dITP diphosphohydrolase|nr:RdgB/HAM1 family non-canonical purine NTP pyrophosphatase [Candidatus Cloacimonadota bacterium]MDD2506864.1 RdgB/HAM1 family non-canonical purine NTP pyrophosphatase [Candidatus Cloacimonadota bacterium]MDD4148148.1 RdgB/HAM1 family non-canonical purine NTP pyrophosphatase [Candidatus Cloacimonadota bacterium]MDD4560568.1 RdgB/HAM1 family non-canonical purine NTP pyrophosphatase [Candidatus Cloacimonadota bacterium]